MSRNKWILIAVLAVLTILEIFFVHPAHPETWWQKIKGFPVLLGLLGGFILMIGAKLLGKYYLYRKEDYYDD